MTTLCLAGAVIADLLVLGAQSVSAQQKFEDATMAVPVVGLAFSMGYIADDLNLWAKHGVRMKTVEISGIGAMNSVIAGSTDFTQSSGSALARAAARGQRLLAFVETGRKSVVSVKSRGLG